jgi:hypothetical protein
MKNNRQSAKNGKAAYLQYYYFVTFIIILRKINKSSSPDGTFSFDYTPTGTCSVMPEGVDFCYGNVLSVSPGYWRIGPKTFTLLKCPRPKGCLGGTGFNTTAMSRRLSETDVFVELNLTDYDPGCAEGFHGPLCSTCLTGYFFSQLEEICSKCSPNVSGTQLSLMIIVPIVFLLVLFSAVFFFAPSISDSSDSEGASIQEHATMIWEMISGIVDFITTTFEDILPKTKILLTGNPILLQFNP